MDWWHRFRDDIVGLFRGSEPDFKTFVETMNTVDDAIKFTAEVNFQTNSVNFLDVVISIAGVSIYPKN